MVDPALLREELRRIKKLINEDPKILAKFDKDGNGVIDGDEWEEVRQLVIKRLERREAEAAAREAPPPHAPAAVADEVVGTDLRQQANRASMNGAVGDLDEFVFRQEGGVVGQVFEEMTHRSYQVYAPSGAPIATIRQNEIEAIQNMTNRSILELPELTFTVVDLVNQEQLSFTRQSAGLGIRLDITDGKGLMIGYAQSELALLKSKFKVVSALGGHPWVVTRPLWNPLNLEIKDSFDETRGTIHRQWSGLGSFLTGSNQMHVELQPGRGTRELRWGLVACMLLADLAASAKR